MTASRFLPFVVLLAAGCGGGDAGDARVVVVDSAGVQIVESPGELRVPEWRLSSQPTLSIGVLEGEQPYQLDQVTSALLHGDRIIIANGRSRELRYFDLTGKHVQTVGRQGGGPGEFESLDWMARHDGDSIITYDRRNRRFSIFDAGGTFVRSFAPEQPIFFVGGRFADGSLVVPPTVSFMAGSAPQGLVRDSAAIVRLSADGAGADTLVRVIAGEYVVESSERMMMARPRPFGLSTYIAVGDSLLFVGTGDTYQIAGHDVDGRLVRLIRRDLQRSRVGSAEIEAYRERQLTRATDDNARREEERRLAGTPFPERMPAHGRLKVDDEGNLWVEEYSTDRDAPQRWTIFTAEGQPIGVATTPARFAVYQIGSDFVLGRWQDQDDVEYVVVYRLERSGSREFSAGAPQ